MNGLAWRAAYDDLLPERVPDAVAEPPSDEWIDDRLAAVRADGNAVRPAEADDSGGDTDGAEGERSWTDDGTDTNGVLGYVYVHWTGTKPFVGPDEAGLKEIYVRPDVWGEGIGTALLERGIALLPDDVEGLRLETLRGDEVGRRFYGARGFERAGEATFEIGEGNYPTDIYVLELRSTARDRERFGRSDRRVDAPVRPPDRRPGRPAAPRTPPRRAPPRPRPRRRRALSVRGSSR